MKCEKCGAELKEGCVYCSVCGAEVQLVPEYNLLDEDLLGMIVQDGDKKAEELPSEEKKRKSRIPAFIIAGICMVILIMVPAILYVKEKNLQNYRNNSYDYQFEQGEISLDAEDFTNALAYFNRALELQPKDTAARKGILKVYLDMGEEANAVSILKELLAENPSDRESVEQLIAIYDRNEDYEQILALYEEVEHSEMTDLFAEYLVESPTFDKVSGTYSDLLEISILSEDGDDIYYTTDGTDPILNGVLYQNSISLEEEGTTVIFAVARNKKGIYSGVANAIYTIRYEPPAMPSVAPPGGAYEEAQMITVDVPEDCTAYYTWDGSEPTANSARYTGPLEMPQGNQVLSVILINRRGLKSRVYRVNYVYMPQ